MKSNVQHRKHAKRLNKHKTSVSVYCILATVTYKTQQILWPCNAKTVVTEKH